MSYCLDICSVLLILSGLGFFLGASVGLVRFPDFYTRMHAAGKGDTLSTLLITAGMALQVLGNFDLVNLFVAMKIMGIGVLIMLTSPTSTHLLMKAGYDDGIDPVTGRGKEGIIDLGGPFLKESSSDSLSSQKSVANKNISKKSAMGKKSAGSRDS